MDLPSPIPAGIERPGYGEQHPCRFNAASQRGPLGDSRTTPIRITPLHFSYCVDEFSFGPFRGRRMAAPGRKQQAVFSLSQHAVEIEQRRRPQDHCTTQNAGWVHEKDAQTGDDTLGGAEVGSPIENQWLMFDEHRLGNDGTEASRSR